MCTTFTYVQCAYLRLEWTMALVQGHIEIASLESAVWTIQTRRINIHKTHKQNQFSDEFFARLRRAPFPFPQSSHWVEWTLLHCLRYGWNCTRMKRELIQLDYNEKKTFINGRKNGVSVRNMAVLAHLIRSDLIYINFGLIFPFSHCSREVEYGIASLQSIAAVNNGH